MTYADLNKVSLKEAWYSAEIVKLREMHLNKFLENTLCNNCIYNSREVPMPIVEELSTKFDEKLLNDSTYVIEQLRKYNKIKYEEE